MFLSLYYAYTTLCLYYAMLILRFAYTRKAEPYHSSLNLCSHSQCRPKLSLPPRDQNPRSAFFSVLDKPANSVINSGVRYGMI